MTKEKSTPQKLNDQALELEQLSLTPPPENLSSTRKRLYLKSEEKQYNLTKELDIFNEEKSFESSN